MTSTGLAGAAMASLAYPERFTVVSEVAGAPLHEGIKAGNDGALLMYSLYMQATHGKCNMDQPSMWNVTEYAKWRCWSAISHMGKMEAMRRYVKTVEEEKPDIWHEVALSLQAKKREKSGSQDSVEG
ncbi:hypothetical protein AAMO2058_001750900, partial [Amorphochlora amoebiformis]